MKAKVVVSKEIRIKIKNQRSVYINSSGCADSTDGITITSGVLYQLFYEIARIVFKRNQNK